MNEFCEKYFCLIEDLIEGELGGETALETETHVFDCAECRHEYELLRREKEVLAHYLFDFEPPPDSWTNLQSRMTEKTNQADVTTIEIPKGKKLIFSFGFSPAFAAVAAILIMVFSIVFVLLKKSSSENHSAQTEPKFEQNASSIEISQKRANDSQEKSIPARSETVKNEETSTVQKIKKNVNLLKNRKSFAAETESFKQKTASSGDKKIKLIKTEANEEEQTALVQKQKLETEIALQIEKIEMLLRSFRNAREIESGDGFDVDYEKTQARRLLDASERLRREAETFGLADDEKLLSRVEPLLLEIANLGENPPTGEVRELKKRVSSQNIIAGLQVYGAATKQ